LTCITSIGLDHTQWLGKTETAIAWEKAGIIKPGVPVISGARGKAAEVVAQSAREKGSVLWQMDRHFYARAVETLWKRGYQRIRFTGIKGVTRTLELQLLGDHQAENAALALACIEVLQSEGWAVPPKAVERGLATVVWLGRFQLVKGPGQVDVLLDGAHNPPAMERFLKTLRQSPWAHKAKTMVFAVFKDKDYVRLLKLLRPLAQNVIVCNLPNRRALPSKDLLKCCGALGLNAHLAISPKAAYRLALQITDPKDVIIVTGSLHLVGDILSLTMPNSNPPTQMNWTKTFSIHSAKGFVYA
jgi:dihydrofolate synthase/folylpolyglutamate synthase